MNRKQFLVTATVAGLSVAMMPPDATEAEPQAPLAVKIVPSEILLSGNPHDATLVRYISLLPKYPHLHIAIQNISNRPIRIWADGNSCGCHNLTIDVTAVEGNPLEKPLKVMRGSLGLGGNVAVVSVLDPGEILVREVELAVSKDPFPIRSGWAYWDFPMLPNTASYKVRMRAVLEIPADENARQMEVWTGRIASPTYDYTIAQG